MPARHALTTAALFGQVCSTTTLVATHGHTQGKRPASMSTSQAMNLQAAQSERCLLKGVVARLKCHESSLHRVNLCEVCTPK
jgi:hypothetical protein